MSNESPGDRHPKRSGGNRFAIVLALIVVCGGVLGAVVWAAQVGSDDGPKALLHTVERGDLVITVTEDGNLESASNRDLVCEVEKGSTILTIVEDGTQVQAGEILVELDKSGIEDQLRQQKITVEKARATKIQADVDVEVAEISIEEYMEGTYKKELQDIESLITVAKEDLRSAESSLEYTKRMMRKGYRTQLQLEAQEFAVERAKLDLASAETSKTVLEKFTKTKTLKDLEAKRDAAKAKMFSEQSALDFEESTLKRLEAQLEKCVIKAPQAGMVVYANAMGRWNRGQQSTIEEGAAVRERQTILQLPDLAQMQVKVTVHESKVELLRRDMPAAIRIQDRELKGRVVRVATQPEAGGWMQANVKEYATTVKIDGQPEGLKPGMTAEVEILINHLSNVVSMPVQAVVEQKGKFYCWINTPSGPEQRLVVIGQSNDKFIEIKDGIAQGDQVLLNPRAVVPQAREEVPDAKAVDVEDTFGAGAAEQAERSRTQPAPEISRGDQGGGRRGSSQGGPGAGSGGPGGGGQRGLGGQGRRGGGGRGNFDPAAFFQRMDTDGDGKLAGDEISGQMRDGLSETDTDGDGAISLEEFRARMRRFSGGRGRGGRGGGAAPGAAGDSPAPGGADPAAGAGGGSGRSLMDNDKNGDGKLAKDELPSFMQRFFDRWDTNSDGFIDPAEIAARREQSREEGDGEGGGVEQ